MSSKQKLYPVDRENRNDGVYERPPQNDADEFGKRAVVPSRPKQTKPVGEKDMSPDPGDVKGASEDDAFKKAHDRIAQLQSGSQDHDF